jgi:transcriptional regulator GlxA family with amidase domain
MNVAILLFEGFDELDAVAPYEVFETAGDFGAGVTAEFVTLDEIQTTEAAHGMRIESDRALADADPGLLVVPGGGWNDRTSPGVWTEYERGAIPDAVARLYDDGTTIASVCTGAMLLAKAGLLDGRPATTHHTALDDLRETDASVRETRFIDDGDVLTAAGITSGFDLALHLVEREVGEETAERVARELEYERTV